MKWFFLYFYFFISESASRLKFQVVKYEDLVENPERNIRSLFRFFDVRNIESFVQAAAAKLEEFQKPEPRTFERIAKRVQLDRLQLQKLMGLYGQQRVRRSVQGLDDSEATLKLRRKSYGYLLEYYGTYRKLNFTHDHWKTELPAKILAEIQNNAECKRALQLLKYPIHSAVPGNGSVGLS